jgi:integrase
VQMRLTAALVRELTQEQAPTKETVIFDTVLQRFALRLKPPRPSQPERWAGWYFVRYVGPDGRERKCRVGSPATMDLDAARKAARAALRRADEGGDPAADKAAARAAWTVREAVEAYLASPDYQRKSDKTRLCDAGTLTNHVVYRLGAEKLSTVDVPAVRRLIRAIEQDTRRNSRKRRLGGTGAARKATRVLSAVLTWAVGEGRLARNPIVGNLRLGGDGVREVVLTEPAQYGALLRAMDELVAHGKLRPQSRAFLITAAFTGMRRSELRQLCWGQVDLSGRRITLVGTKGARLTRRGPKTETVSLPPIAAATLAGIRPEDAAPDERVFIPQRGDVIEINRDWLRVRAAAGLPADLTLHGLRHSIGTVAIMAGLSLAEVQKLLRHRTLAMTSHYVHLADRARLQDRAMAAMAPQFADLTLGRRPLPEPAADSEGGERQ